ncbi:MAG TPA: hypothetical protein GXX31_00780 [Methanothermobacter sp.]|jgi:hypothetical protein|uniref:Uncharacterized protein n=1 Tax=Methanothermobacter tenebrarum TaxID=680118 RepID=A0ABN6PB68_9EURY|nr:hypothetical protein [Methanothermobacter tenebrarum]MDD3455011.1 hypothetical protein [Methanobacteriales archaeon]MDX9693460.1 hypothetical protein [Methanothermobacter sp.]BDH79482.1 hypothetical protein MTTB_08610 [Methanothermobacter tenebrarum]HHW15909.1 hypothetical protein [Methanothermobacter sp.]HOQ20423.1 hypothetical protein [Methanothermobacter sp.]
MEKIVLGEDLPMEDKLLACLFWAVRKTIREEGCAPLRINKIETSTETYKPEGRKLLKLSQHILDNIMDDMGKGRMVSFELSMGGEVLRVYMDGESFAVESEKTKDLEKEITNKIVEEMKRKRPDFCQTFIPKIIPGG